MNIQDHISESNFRVKILKSFDAVADPEIFLTLDPGSTWMEKIRIQDKHSGSQHWKEHSTFISFTSYHEQQ